MSKLSPLLRHQQRFFERLAALGLRITDASLVAYLGELGVPALDPSMLSHYRAGRYAAPLGLLWPILWHCDGVRERAAVLGLIGREIDCLVIPDPSVAAHGTDLPDAATRVVRTVLELLELLHQADDVPAAWQVGALEDAGEQARAAIAELVARAQARSRGVGVPR